MGETPTQGRQDVASGFQLGRLEACVGFRMRRIRNCIAANFASATSHYGIRPGLFSALALIEANPGISQQQLFRILDHDKSTIVHMIEELERRGWAKQERSIVDRRRQSLTILPDGLIALDGLFASLSIVEGNAFSQLNAEEQAIFNAALDRMYSVLQHKRSRSVKS